MKFTKKIISLISAALLLGGAMLTVGCGDADTEGGSSVADGGDVEYSVTVKDYNGNALESGVIAVFTKDGKEHKQPCGSDGVATKTLPSGDYDLSLTFTDGDEAYYYNTDGLTLDNEKNTLDIVLYPRVSGETVPVAVPRTVTDESGESTTVYEETAVFTLKEGCTYVEVTPGGKTYFRYVPNRAGIYQLSVEWGDGCTFGYYGGTNFVRESPVYEIVDGKSSVTVENGGVTDDPTNTTVWMLAVQSETASACIVKVERIGDPAWNVSQEEWTIYETTADLEPCVLPEGTVLKDFDLTQAYDIVYNENDGYYHVGSVDGALVYAYLTVNTEFVDSFKTILEEGTVRAYFYDADGKFIKKEAYGNCLKEYFEYADENYGVYPLTADLKYIFQSFGEHKGWWDESNPGFIVEVEGLNVDSAWLFMCCYAE